VVSTATGEPVRHASVAVLAEEDSRTIAAVESDNEGHFAFDRLEPAKYQLTVSKRGYRTAFYDEHDEFNTAIVTGADQDTGSIVFKLSPGATLRGVITADGGDPVENARVMLFRKPGSHRPDERVTQIDTEITDDTGSYEFSNLAAGDYFVAVSADPWYAMHDSPRSPKLQRQAAATADEGKRALDVTYPVTFFDSTTDEAAATTISLASGAHDEADINLHAVPALRLTVETPPKQNGGIARAELRQTVFGTVVSAQSGGFLYGNSDQTGTMEFGGVAPGHYQLAQGDPPRVADFDAATSQLVDPAMGTPTESVSGTIRMAQGMAADGMAVPEELSLELEPMDPNRRQDPIQAAAVRGGFTFSTVPPGKYLLSVSGGARAVSVASITVGGRTHAGGAVTVQNGALALVVTISEGGTRLQGFAKSEGKGAAGAMIVLVPKDLSAYPSLVRRDQSDSDGSFALRDVVPGAYTIIALADAWDLNWSDPAFLARYLPGGVAVTLSDTSGKTQSLAQPVPVQRP
jgi:protocatechuate 3,4-dioxygenase beta subunit